MSRFIAGRGRMPRSKKYRLRDALAAALEKETRRTRQQMEHLEFRLEGRELIATLKRHNRERGI